MKFLADENISPIVVTELRKSGHDVLDLKEKGLRGLSDNEIGKLAVKEIRTILTHDTTFIKSISPDIRVKILLITFKQKEATREKMNMVAWYISDKAKYIFKKKTRIYLKLEAETLKIFPIA